LGIFFTTHFLRGAYQSLVHICSGNLLATLGVFLPPSATRNLFHLKQRHGTKANPG
jgi:hypothetical protein